MLYKQKEWDRLESSHHKPGIIKRRMQHGNLLPPFAINQGRGSSNRRGHKAKQEFRKLPTKSESLLSNEGRILPFRFIHARGNDLTSCPVSFPTTLILLKILSLREKNTFQSVTTYKQYAFFFRRKESNNQFFRNMEIFLKLNNHLGYRLLLSTLRVDSCVSLPKNLRASAATS